MRARVIYRGGHHRVICRRGLHFKVFEDGHEERVEGIGSNCSSWVGGCKELPARAPWNFQKAFSEWQANFQEEAR